MAVLETITTADAQYQTDLTRWRQVRNTVRPRMKHFFRLSKDRQRAWLQRDPLLRELIEFAERVGIASEDS